MADSEQAGDRADDLFAEVLARLDSLSQAAPAGVPGGLEQALRHFDGELRRLARKGTLSEPALEALLRRHWGEAADPCVSLDSEPTGEAWPAEGELERLASGMPDRYRFLGEIGRGGMGVVLKVWDSHLRRVQALKLSRRAGRASARELTRFLEEAQVAAQLDHPGILPVYDLGVLPDGQVYFTMQLVRGERLTDAFERVWRGEPEWSLARTVGVLLQVAEAMAYAHDKGVLHRDLKPSNVMVGRFGEVHVLDWGLAKVRGRDPESPASPAQDAGQRVSTTRAESDGAVALTRTGTALGTPAYMAPEQAAGEPVDARADVYSLGAMLYHLLAREAPYAKAGSGAALWRRIAAGPPDALESLAPGAPAELVAVATHAMAPKPSGRYADMTALARDLRAWLEGRVVSVHDRGPWMQVKKWIARNRALAAACAAALTLLLAGAAVSTILYLRAEARATDVLRLSAMRDHAQLRERARSLWPPYPEQAAAYREWIAEAERLIALVPNLEARRAELEARELPADPAELERLRHEHPSWPELEQVRAEIRQAEELLAAVEREGRELDRGEQAAAAWLPGARALAARLQQDVESSLPARFEQSSDAWWYEQVVTLLQDVRGLEDPRTGLLSGVDPELGPGIERRLEWAQTLDERTRSGPDARQRWTQALASIRDPEDCPAYEGLAIEPQMGLLPLGRNPQTGLWEFWSVITGEEPALGPAGGYRVDESSGLVLVLLPGGAATVGAERSDASSPRYDPYANPAEGPPLQVRLDPFFASKYELTQGQWVRMTGERPSTFGEASTGTLVQHAVTDANPVETVSWRRAHEVLGWFGLALPTESQWEYAARAGTETPWWCGPRSTDLDGAENLSDATAGRAGATWGPVDFSLDDGFLVHAPVGSFRPNPFGLFDVLGNVREFCRDRIGDFAGTPPREGDGFRSVSPTTSNRVIRGGAFAAHPRGARVTQRVAEDPDASFSHTGIRPIRALEGRWTRAR